MRVENLKQSRDYCWLSKSAWLWPKSGNSSSLQLSSNYCIFIDANTEICRKLFAVHIGKRHSYIICKGKGGKIASPWTVALLLSAMRLILLIQVMCWWWKHIELDWLLLKFCAEHFKNNLRIQELGEFSKIPRKWVPHRVTAPIIFIIFCDQSENWTIDDFCILFSQEFHLDSSCNAFMKHHFLGGRKSCFQLLQRQSPK